MTGSPYRLIVTDDPCKTLGQGEVRYFPTILRAANEVREVAAPFKQIIFAVGKTSSKTKAGASEARSRPSGTAGTV